MAEKREFFEIFFLQSASFIMSSVCLIIQNVNPQMILP